MEISTSSSRCCIVVCFSFLGLVYGLFPIPEEQLMQSVTPTSWFIWYEAISKAAVPNLFDSRSPMSYKLMVFRSSVTGGEEVIDSKGM